MFVDINGTFFNMKNIESVECKRIDVNYYEFTVRTCNKTMMYVYVETKVVHDEVYGRFFEKLCEIMERKGSIDFRKMQYELAKACGYEDKFTG